MFVLYFIKLFHVVYCILTLAKLICIILYSLLASVCIIKYFWQIKKAICVSDAGITVLINLVRIARKQNIVILKIINYNKM